MICLKDQGRERDKNERHRIGPQHDAQIYETKMKCNSNNTDGTCNNRVPRDEDGDFVGHVPGLEYYRDFLSLREQQELLDLIYANPWQEGVIARRQQFYGEVYYHTSFKSKMLQGCSSNEATNGNDYKRNGGTSEIANGEGVGDNNNSVPIRASKQKEAIDSQNNNYDNGKASVGIPIETSGMRKWLDKTMPFFEREGLISPPTQVLINEYKNNMGIASHFEDFDAFGPVILTISLISPVYMTLKKPTNNPDALMNESNSNGSDDGRNINACDSYDDVIKVLLEPGSLLIMKDDARYKYRHGIGKYKWVALPSDPAPSPSLSPVPSSSPVATSRTRIKRDDSYRRVSLTIRHLLSTRRKVRDNEDESNTIKDPSVY